MGFFDKMRTFVGEHGLKVQITKLEQQQPGSVRFKLTDSVFKGNYEIIAERPCKVLNHLHEVIVVKTHPDKREEQVVLGSELYDEKTEIGGSDLKWPYEIGAGETKKAGFCIIQMDIPAELRKLGYGDPAAAASAPELQFFVRVTADVEGTILDAEAKAPFTGTA